MRAEDLYPAATRPDLPTLDARVELVEALGSGVMAYFHVEVDAYRRSRRAAQVAVDGEGDPDPASTLDGALAAQPNLVAHFPPRVELRLGDTVPVAIDPARSTSSTWRRVSRFT